MSESETVVTTVEPAKEPRAQSSVGQHNGLLWSGVGLIVAGVLAGLLILVFLIPAAANIASSFSSDPIPTPGSGQVELTEGTHIVLQRADGTDQKLAPADIAVLAPSGAVSVDINTVSETYEFAGVVFESVATFDAAESGVYTVSVGGAGPSEVLIRPSLLWTFLRGGAAAIVVVLAGSLALVGASLLIARAVIRAGEAKPAPGRPAPGLVDARSGGYPAPVDAQHGSAAPAGWYPDVEAPGQFRYWDGSDWTEIRH